MGLDNLPSEVLAHICSYLYDLYDLSLTNHYLRSICSRFMFRSLSAAYPHLRLDEILNFAQSSNSLNVYKLFIENTEQLASFGTTVNSSAKQLINRILAFKGLKRFACNETVLGLLEDEELQRLKHLKLEITRFHLRRGVSPRVDTATDLSSRTLNIKNLASLECYVPLRDIRWQDPSDSDNEISWADDEDIGGPPEDEFDHEFLRNKQESKYIGQVLSFISAVCPQLEALALVPTYALSCFDPPVHKAGRLGLTRLDLSRIDNSQPEFFRLLGKLSQLEVLQAFSLPLVSETTLDWLAHHPLPLRGLQEFEMEIGESSAEPLLMNDHLHMILEGLPSLKKLAIFGPSSVSLSRSILEHHATLESLKLQDSRQLGRVLYNNLWTVDQLEAISQLQHLEYLCITLHRFLEDGLNHWDLLRLSSVKFLTLILECTLPLFEDHPSPSRQSTLESGFKRFALDGDLVKTIFESCDLEQLHVMTVGLDVFGDPQTSFYDSQTETLQAIIAEIQGSYQCRRRGGRIQVLDVSDEMPRASQGAKATEDTEPMRVFREIWPSKGGDWREDWHSLPISLKDTGSQRESEPTQMEAFAASDQIPST